MVKPEIKEIGYGLGFTVQDGKKRYIELNRNLKKYPKLRKKILDHEMLHWNAKDWKEDFKIDFLDIFQFKKNKELIRFNLKYPKSLLCNSPIFFEEGKIVPNWFMVFTSIALISLITGGIVFVINII